MSSPGKQGRDKRVAAEKMVAAARPNWFYEAKDLTHGKHRRATRPNLRREGANMSASLPHRGAAGVACPAVWRGMDGVLRRSVA